MIKWKKRMNNYMVLTEKELKKMSKEELNFNVIDPNTVFIKCEYDAYAINEYKKAKIKDFLLRLLPSVQIQLDKEHLCNPFYFIDQCPLKRPLKLYELNRYKEGKKVGTRDVWSREERGILTEYKDMCLISKRGYTIKYLHDMLANQVKINDGIKECEIFWGEEDDRISRSIMDYKAFGDLEDWKSLKQSREVLERSEKIREEKDKERELKKATKRAEEAEK